MTFSILITLVDDRRKSPAELCLTEAALGVARELSREHCFFKKNQVNFIIIPFGVSSIPGGRRWPARR